MALTKEQQQQADAYRAAARRMGSGFLTSGGRPSAIVADVGAGMAVDAGATDHNREVRTAAERDGQNNVVAAQMDTTSSVAGVIARTGMPGGEIMTPEEKERKEFEEYLERKRLIDEYIKELDAQIEWHSEQIEKLRKENELARQQQEEIAARSDQMQEVVNDCKKSGKLDRPKAEKLLAASNVTIPAGADDVYVLLLLQKQIGDNANDWDELNEEIKRRKKEIEDHERVKEDLEHNKIEAKKDLVRYGQNLSEEDKAEFSSKYNWKEKTLAASELDRIGTTSYADQVSYTDQQLEEEYKSLAKKKENTSALDSDDPMLSDIFASTNDGSDTEKNETQVATLDSQLKPVV